MSFAEFESIATARRSTRDFLADPVDQKLLEQILELGITAPSWSNTRPFMVGVATGEQRDRISEKLVSRLRANANEPGMGNSPDFTHEIPYPAGLVERSQRVGKGIYDTLGIDRADKESRFRFLERNYEFFGAPVALFFFTHRGLDHFGTLDLGLYMENVMLAAQAAGLGTCAQGYLGNYPDIIKEEFDVPAEYALVCGMSLGYPSNHPINGWKAERLPLGELTAKPKH